MALETMTKIGSYTVGSDTAAYSITNIPQGYTDLRVKISSKTTYTSSDYDLIYCTINSDATVANYNYVRLQGEATTSTTTTGQTGVFVRTNGSSTGVANYFGNAEITFYNYSGNTVKQFSVDSVQESNVTAAIMAFMDGLWSGVSPITSLTFYPNNNLIAANTTFTLYGVKNAQKTTGNSIKATGGNIVFDGTYVYHVFNSTGAFVPTTALTAQVLVVAGGGGGAPSTNWNGFGGAGAGGLLIHNGKSLTANATYTCTVGSGGASDSVGSNSYFADLITYGGGTPNSSAGGSGAGGSGRDVTPPPGGASTQTSNGGGVGYGNAGGAGHGGNTGTPYYNAGGGGGGAGGAGENSDARGTLSGGNGGVGLTNAFINSLGVATGVGQYVSGNYYFAGGAGGAGSNGSSSAGIGGYGGGGNSDYATGVGSGAVAAKTAGLANTGGGGGSANNSAGGDSSGKPGGSGIIVVRYKG